MKTIGVINRSKVIKHYNIADLLAFADEKRKAFSWDYFAAVQAEIAL